MKLYKLMELCSESAFEPLISTPLHKLCGDCTHSHHPDSPDIHAGAWDYQWCTESMAQELPYFPTTGDRDMFWDQGPFNTSLIREHCLKAWGVEPQPHWSLLQYGGTDLRDASNIVLSNGNYDPWSVFGVLQDVSPSVVAVIIEVNVKRGLVQRYA